MFSPQEFDLLVRAQSIATQPEFDTSVENVLECLLYHLRIESPLSGPETELKALAEAINPDVDDFLSNLLNRLERHEQSVLGSAFGSMPLAA